MNIEHLWTPPAGERIVSTVLFRDHIYVATDAGVYRITEIDNAIKVELLQLKTFLRGKNSDTQDALADFEERWPK